MTSMCAKTKNYFVLLEAVNNIRNPNKLTSTHTSISVTSPTCPESVNVRTPTFSGKTSVVNACVLACVPEQSRALLKLACETGANRLNLGEASIDVEAETAKDPGNWVRCEQVLGGEKATGSIIVWVLEYHHDPMVTIESGTNLKNTDGRNDLSDPYGVLSGLLGPSMIFGQTDTVHDHLYPHFKNNTFIINLLEKMPAGGLLTPCKVELKDEDEGKRDDELGHVIIGWKDLFLGAGASDLKLSDVKLKGEGSLTDKRNAVNLVISMKREEGEEVPPAPVSEEAVSEVPVAPVSTEEVQAAEEPTSTSLETVTNTAVEVN